MGLNQGSCPTGRYWEIKKGDTLYLISLRVGTTVAELERLNSGVDPNNLQIGQQICLPVKRDCPSGIYWEVAQGDSLIKIAQTTGTTVEELLKLNPYINPQDLKIGQAICLPE